MQGRAARASSPRISAPSSQPRRCPSCAPPPPARSRTSSRRSTRWSHQSTLTSCTMTATKRRRRCVSGRTASKWSVGFKTSCARRCRPQAARTCADTRTHTHTHTHTHAPALPQPPLVPTHPTPPPLKGELKEDATTSEESGEEHTRMSPPRSHTNPHPAVSTGRQASPIRPRRPTLRCEHYRAVLGGADEIIRCVECSEVLGCVRWAMDRLCDECEEAEEMGI
mmetsp:Transcript_29984/g.75460  ORF Transcript_29984/g.75460 Transcript_29984/m.75460 type:complete len:224 (+) Transcript_29984:115-786(+)